MTHHCAKCGMKFRPVAPRLKVAQAYPKHRIEMMARMYCDRCLTPFTQSDCYPDCTPQGEDWSELCPSCRDRRLKYYLEEREEQEEAA